MDGITELALMLKERNNPPVQGVGIGAVVSADPLSVRFNGFVLDARNSVVSEHLTAKKTTGSTAVGDHGSHTHTVDYTLKEGDSVIVIPSADGQTFFIVGKVG